MIMEPVIRSLFERAGRDWPTGRQRIPREICARAPFWGGGEPAPILDQEPATWRAEGGPSFLEEDGASVSAAPRGQHGALLELVAVGGTEGK